MKCFPYQSSLAPSWDTSSCRGNTCRGQVENKLIWKCHIHVEIQFTLIWQFQIHVEIQLKDILTASSHRRCQTSAFPEIRCEKWTDIILFHLYCMIILELNARPNYWVDHNTCSPWDPVRWRHQSSLFWQAPWDQWMYINITTPSQPKQDQLFVCSPMHLPSDQPKVLQWTRCRMSKPPAWE